MRVGCVVFAFSAVFATLDAAPANAAGTATFDGEYQGARSLTRQASRSCTPASGEATARIRNGVI